MTNDAVTVTCGDVLIVYDEKDNVWRFTLRGRERSSVSLAKAKEAIDKPVPGGKAKAFQRVKAYKKSYGNDFELGEVTSIAETTGWRGETQVWFNSVRNGRTKVGLTDLYSDTAGNQIILSEIESLKKQATALNDKADAVAEKMSPLKLDIPE